MTLFVVIEKADVKDGHDQRLRGNIVLNKRTISTNDNLLTFVRLWSSVNLRKKDGGSTTLSSSFQRCTHSTR
jgi:hypothetical protein